MLFVIENYGIAEKKQTGLGGTDYTFRYPALKYLELRFKLGSNVHTFFMSDARVWKGKNVISDLLSGNVKDVPALEQRSLNVKLPLLPLHLEITAWPSKSLDRDDYSFSNPGFDIARSSNGEVLLDGSDEDAVSDKGKHIKSILNRSDVDIGIML